LEVGVLTFFNLFINLRSLYWQQTVFAHGSTLVCSPQRAHTPNRTDMENKLSQITKKLYDEGLAKGRSEGERIVAEAEAGAKKIVAAAEQKARDIVRKAEAHAAELRGNTATEIALAGRQAVARIKDEIAGVVTARSIDKGVGAAGIDPAFIREMLLAVAKNWRGASAEKVTLEALLPADKQKEFDKAFAASAAALLREGIEVGYSPSVRSGFRVGEKNGGYYISFEDENFEALLGTYLRDRVAKILFEAK
jgi:V/A-type H+-transporting ATPase subunit E